MKTCRYCGRENDDTAVYCGGCWKSFTTETPGKFSDVVRWTSKSPLGVAFTSGLAALFICTGIFFTIGRIMRDIVRMHHIDNGVPANYDICVFVHPAITWTLFSLGALIFTFFICYNRCQKKTHGIITAIITLGIIALLTVGLSSLVYIPYPECQVIPLLVPMIALGLTTGFSAGYYIGAALQIVVGAWLLGWFKPRNDQEEKCTPAQV